MKSRSPFVPVDFAGMGQRVAKLAWGSCVCWLAACTPLASKSDGLSENDEVGVAGSNNAPTPPAPGQPPPGSPGSYPSENEPSGVVTPGPDGVSPPLDASVPVPAADAAAIDPGDTELPACAGFALSLDGSNYASIPRLVQDDFTLEAWIKTATSRVGNSAFYAYPVFDADIIGSGDNDDFLAGVMNDRFVFGVGNPDTTVEGITAVTTDAWVHVALTRQAATGQLRVIVNGALDGTAVAPNRNALSAQMNIALGGAALVRNFVGLIDEVRIWNVARSVEDIASSFRSRLSGSESGLVGYYTFEDRGASVTADLSATGAPAVFMGAPSYAPSSALCLAP